MLALVIRAISAADMNPMAIDGSVIDRSHGITPSDMDTYPSAGNHPRLTAKTHIKFAPSQNDGIASPATANTISALSTQVFAFQAAKIPAGTAIIIATSCEKMAMDIVGSSRCPISVVTGNFVKTDSPKSPRRISQK